LHPARSATRRHSGGGTGDRNLVAAIHKSPAGHHSKQREHHADARTAMVRQPSAMRIRKLTEASSGSRCCRRTARRKRSTAQSRNSRRSSRCSRGRTKAYRGASSEVRSSVMRPIVNRDALQPYA
jgi:hypothetical protein